MPSVATTTPATTATTFTKRVRLHSTRVTTTVRESTEELWKCQEPENAALWLQLLCQALLRERLELYDPSDTFLSIQGAALRFSKHQEEGVLVWEEAMWCTAALARVCVGPAWNYQNQQRRIQLLSSPQSTANNNNNTTSNVLDSSSSNININNNNNSVLESPMEVLLSSNSSDNPSPRSFSPMTFASTLDMATTTSMPWYPVIPEILPGAMLRFGAICPHRSVAEAQREMVTALCCFATSTDETSLDRTTDWTIPGAHEPVGTMMKLWFGLNKDNNNNNNNTDKDDGDGGGDEQQPLDWYYTLQMARACTDLASAGWRPLSGSIGILRCLVRVAERGLSLDIRHEPTDTSAEAREERLTAVTCAWEALSAVNSLASRGLIPTVLQTEIVRSLIRLQVQGKRQSIDSVYPVDKSSPSSSSSAAATASPEEIETSQQDRETFASRMHACMNDVGDLMWMFLAHDSSSESTLAVITELLENRHDKTQLTVLVSILHGALFGNSPTGRRTPDIPKLRIFWREYLELFGSIMQDSLEAFQTRKPQWKEFWDVSKEVLSAIKSFAAAGLIQRAGLLPSDDWVCFINLIEEAVIPWLRHRKQNVGDDVEDAANVRRLLKSNGDIAESILRTVGDHLEGCSLRQGSSLQFALDEEQQERLFLTLLRQGCPLMSGSSSLLAIAVVQCWGTSAFQPHRRDTWVSNAASIFAESFAVYREEGQLSEYVHSAEVRLEALKVLTEDTTNQPTATVDDGDPNALSIPSPLSLTEHLEDQYVELIQTAILPPLCMIFEASPSAFSVSCEPHVSSLTQILPDHCDQDNTVDNTKSSVTVAEFELQKFAIHLVGRLFRNAAAEEQHSIFFVELLESIAIDTEIHCSSVAAGGPELLSKKVMLSLEAILELELCLCSNVSSSGGTDSFVILCEALFSIVDHYSGHLIEESDVSHSEHDACRVLLFGALLPLSRFRSDGRNGDLKFIPRAVTWNHLPSVLKPLFALSASCEIDTPLGVNENQSVTNPSEGDNRAISMEKLVACLLKLLTTMHSATRPVKPAENSLDARQVDGRIRATCYDCLFHYALSYQECSCQLLRTVITLPQPDGPYAVMECTSRLRAVSCLLQRCLSSDLTDEQTTRYQNDLLEIVERVSSVAVDLCISASEAEVVAASRLIRGLLPRRDVLSLGRVTASVVQSLRIRVAEDKCSSSLVAVTVLISLLFSLLSMTESAVTVPTDSIDEYLSICRALSVDHRQKQASRLLAVKCMAILLEVKVEDNNLESGNDREVKGQIDLWRSLLLRRRARELSMKSKYNADDRLRKCEFAKRFKSDKSASWLYGETLFTLRVGADGTRYRGWMEINVRGPAVWWRELRAIPGMLSLNEPEPSSLLRQRGGIMEQAQSIQQTQSPYGDSDVLKSALALLNKADRLTRSDHSTKVGRQVSLASSDYVGPDDGFAPQLLAGNAPDQNKVSSWLNTQVDNGGELMKYIRETLEVLGLSSVFLTDGSMKARKLSSSTRLDRAVSLLDRTFVADTSKVALLYAVDKSMEALVDEGDCLLHGIGASPAFLRFIEGLGVLVKTEDLRFFSGGLDTSGANADGKFTLISTEDEYGRRGGQIVLFHTVALMPTGVTCRKRHVGNDNVFVIYLENTSQFVDKIEFQETEMGQSVVSGDFGFVQIYVMSITAASWKVSVRLRPALEPGIRSILSLLVGDDVVPSDYCSTYVLHLATLADLLCSAEMTDLLGPCSNWEDRFGQIVGMERYA